MTRRSFFQGAAMALSAGRVMGANDRIRVGIVGMGGRGRNHLDGYVKVPGCRVAAVCDVNQAARERAQAMLLKAAQDQGKEYADMRDLFADKDIDAVSIATPNHWHALAAIWACEAGKDVYVEKPASHNVYEGWRMVETARKTGRMVQVGLQSRSTPLKIKAMQLLRDGVIGKLYLAKGLCFKRRRSIGKSPQEPVPPGLDWDRFLGPAPMRPYSRNRFAYNWHWFWDTGNGDIGNQGAHEMDLCRWALGDLEVPSSVVSSGGKYLYDDDQETPNTQLASFEYGPLTQIVFEVRGLLTGPEGGVPVRPGNVVGNLFYGADGWMWLDGGGFQVYKGEENAKVMDEKGDGDATVLHMQNFLKACRSRNHMELSADIETGAASAALCHFANIAYRVNARLAWDGKARTFDSAAANKLLTREYRKPYVV